LNRRSYVLTRRCLMKRERTLAGVLAVGLLLLLAASSGMAQDSSPQAALGTAFTYQGRLTDVSGPVNDICDFTFGLYNSATEGTRIRTESVTGVQVSQGLFTVQLDYGADAFNGYPRWLEISVDCGNGVTKLSPRQPVTPAPYALYAVEACSGGGGGEGWALTGNSGTAPGTNFLGTMDNEALVLKVNSKQALRIEPRNESPNLVGGYHGNGASSTAKGATISGGGAAGGANQVSAAFGTVGGGLDNTASEKHAVVGGGRNNEAAGKNSTVSGGSQNRAGADYASVGGGSENSASGEYATVAGGQYNTADGSNSTVAGGRDNTASGGTICGGAWNVTEFGGFVGAGRENLASGLYSAVAAGELNSATGENAFVGSGYLNYVPGKWSAIAGGLENAVRSNLAFIGGGEENEVEGERSTIGGGYLNWVPGWECTVGGGAENWAYGTCTTIAGGLRNRTGGYASMVPGGSDNSASGDYSLAAGHQAKAIENGCFAWGDSTAQDVECDVQDRWVARASGGVYFYTNSSLTSGVKVNGGGNAWSSASDRELKARFADLNYVEVVERLVQEVPITTWKYKSEDVGIRHIGPVAQDFYAAFGVGDDDSHISTVDADGVALAAIHGLYELVQQKDAQIADLEARVTALEALVMANAHNPEGGQP
jgi:hypothetical protein